MPIAKACHLCGTRHFMTAIDTVRATTARSLRVLSWLDDIGLVESSRYSTRY